MSKKCNPETVSLAKQIYGWAQQEFPEVRFGNGGEVGAFGPSLAVGSPSLFVVRSDGRFTMRFVNLKPKQWGWNGGVLETFLSKLNQIPGASFVTEDLNGKPRRDLSLLIDTAHFKQFQEAVVWLQNHTTPPAN